MVLSHGNIESQLLEYPNNETLIKGFFFLGVSFSLNSVYVIFDERDTHGYAA